jgi:hypothetical protein
MLKLINIRFDCGFNERSAATCAGQCIITCLVVLDAKSNIRAYGLSHIVSRLICTQKAVTTSQHQIDFCAPKTVTLELHTKNGYTGTLDLHTKNSYTGTMLNLILRNKNGYKNKLCTSKAVNNNFNGIAQRDSVSAPLQLHALCY